MGFKNMAATADEGDFEKPQPGSVNAVCTRLIDMGTQPGSQLYPDPKRKLMLGFEIDQTMEDGRRFMVSSWLTYSVHPMAKFRQYLESWRGKAFEDGERVPVEKVPGTAALLGLKESATGYVNIVSISSLPKGMPRLAPEGDIIIFDLEEPDWDAFGKLSEKMQNRIAESPEYQDAKAGFGSTTSLAGLRDALAERGVNPVGAAQLRAPARPAQSPPATTGQTVQAIDGEMVTAGVTDDDFNDDIPF